jgi:hypothetical protein
MYDLYRVLIVRAHRGDGAEATPPKPSPAPKEAVQVKEEPTGPRRERDRKGHPTSPAHLRLQLQLRLPLRLQLHLQKSISLLRLQQSCVGELTYAGPRPQVSFASIAATGSSPFAAGPPIAGM